MNLSDISIVLPTRNERENIRPFLAAIPDDVSLIVVDASTDNTPQLIETLRPRHTRVIQQPSTIAAARQIGAQLAHTPWLLFTDADIVFPPRFFLAILQLKNVDAAYGPKLSRNRFQCYYHIIAEGQKLSQSLGIPAVSGSSFLIKRHVFWHVGGFDVQLSVNEDSEIGWRVKRYGYHIAFVPEMMVFARDHRRLERGITRKTVHSMFRNTLLYFDLLPYRWRYHDWGYWRGTPSENAPE